METSFSQLDINATYSYADYLKWKFDEKLELIKGKISKMTPAPRVAHQKIVWRFSGILYNQLKDSSCQAFQAPFDVRLLDKKKPTNDDETNTKHYKMPNMRKRESSSM